MKFIQNKLQVIVWIISLMTITGLSNCAQKDSKNVETTIDSAKLAADIPVMPVDSQAVIAKSDSSLIEKNVEANKETMPTDKTIKSETVKQTTVVKTVITNTTPVSPAPVVKPVTAPVVAVVKETEPVKPAPVVIPKAVEVPKPVPVVTAPPQQNHWVVPSKYKTMTSPFANDKESIALGKSVYSTHCKSCHGSKGDGNGTKAATLDTKIGSFLSSAFKSQNQGEVYYKSIIGRKDMPKFDKKIPDEEEKWAVVNYIRSL
jgi:cytochrome c5